MAEMTTDKPDDGLPKRLREAWMKTVGTWATDERGTASLFSRLAALGAVSADEARRVIADTRSRIEQNKGELDRRVDESIKKAFSRLSDGAEARRLEERVARLEARLQELEREPKPSTDAHE